MINWTITETVLLITKDGKAPVSCEEQEFTVKAVNSIGSSAKSVSARGGFPISELNMLILTIHFTFARKEAYKINYDLK